MGHFLKREQRPGATYDLDLNQTFRSILTCADDFVPSEAGSIFLDDPVVKRRRPDHTELVLVACFGPQAGSLVGLRLPVGRGIVGHVYLTGEPYTCRNPSQDPHFYNEIDGISQFKTRSVICAPLRVEREVIGVIELLNHKQTQGYGLEDQQLLSVFAQTISASILNAIEAQKSSEMAKRDDLTGLYNDRYLHYTLTRAVADSIHSSSDCGLVFMDLDHFKGINDRHGHMAGSRVLAEMGALLRQILPGHAVPSRYGGDEFVIVLPGSGPQETYWVAETVRQNIERHVFLGSPDPQDPEHMPALGIAGVITASVGIATISQVAAAAESHDTATVKNELVRAADAAMYAAKEAGKNRTVAGLAESA
jgi:diguanylate cyclase (GGDEF)-like protein